jgi:crossover junction endodeoxyribonuclease RuvC
VRVVGIDPGLIVSGYGVLETAGSDVRLIEAGTIDSGNPRDALPYRLRRLHESINGLLDDQLPEAMALETLFSHYEHPRTAILMGHARGVICLAAGLHNVPLHNYTAPQVKSALTGNGRASKEQMQSMVRKTFGLVETPKPPDVADAIAIALCHIYHQRERSTQDYLRLVR